MYHYTYFITVNNPTDERKYYIGVRSCEKAPEEDIFYFGSCKPFSDWQKENGRDGLVKEILSVFPSRGLALEHEIELHNLYEVAKNKLFWNRAKQITTGFDTTGTTDVYNKGIPMSDEQKIKISKAKIGKPLSQEHRDRISKTLNGRRKSEEHKMKIRAANIQRLQSEEYKQLLKMKRMNKELS